LLGWESPAADLFTGPAAKHGTIGTDGYFTAAPTASPSKADVAMTYAVI
jgi:hypothetical protein